MLVGKNVKHLFLFPQGRQNRYIQSDLPRTTDWANDCSDFGAVNSQKSGE